MWKPQNIYSEYILQQPVVLFGKDAIGGLAVYPCARVAVLCSSSLREENKDFLRKVFKRKSLHFIDRSWSGEPDLEGLQGSISALERIQPDVIIAIGGGSVIDGAKLCRLYYEFPFFQVNETKLAQLKFKTRFIAVPTTVGSGTEVSSAAVFINRKYERKEMIVSHDLQPSVVVLDPEYVKNAPNAVIVSSALDAVAHIVEGYVSVMKNNIMNIYAEKGLQILFQELSEKAPEKRDYQRIQFAGYLGGLVQNHCIVGAAHAVAHQLTSYGFSHGEAIALLLPGVIRLNCSASDIAERYALLCHASNIENIDSLIKFVEIQSERAGIAQRKSELKAVLESLKTEKNFVENVCNDRGGKGNPIPITEEYLTKLVEAYL